MQSDRWDLARLAHFSSTTLSDAAGGRRLPSLAVTLAYVTACDGDRAEWQRRWHAVSAELNDLELEHADQAAATAPYVGLAAYRSSDAGRFFGRERLVDDLVARLRRQRFLAVFGPSGAGKSSVLRAGLVPALEEMDSAGPIVLFTPGAHPMGELALRSWAPLRRRSRPRAGGPRCSGAGRMWCGGRARRTRDPFPGPRIGRAIGTLVGVHLPVHRHRHRGWCHAGGVRDLRAW
ncbi:nSTAND1 domain-containing NTPase [Amycolatopsis sp. NBC_00348]|uniref:nSTAND1 domain-containing NTPase n=1 Tax=Amycolatopsis sp. NBC_00348 TaxID=2975956 RepID=UPI002E256C26